MCILIMNVFRTLADFDVIPILGLCLDFDSLITVNIVHDSDTSATRRIHLLKLFKKHIKTIGPDVRWNNFPILYRESNRRLLNRRIFTCRLGAVSETVDKLVAAMFVPKHVSCKVIWFVFSKCKQTFYSVYQEFTILCSDMVSVQTGYLEAPRSYAYINVTQASSVLHSHTKRNHN